MKTFSFAKKVFVVGLTVLSNITNALECISMKNQECEVRQEIVNINSNNPIFYSFSIKINKCSGIVMMLMIHMQEFVFLILKQI